MGISLGKIGYIQSPIESYVTRSLGGTSDILISPEYEANIKKIIKQSGGGTGGGSGANIQGGSTKDLVPETTDTAKATVGRGGQPTEKRFPLNSEPRAAHPPESAGGPERDAAAESR